MKFHYPKSFYLQPNSRPQKIIDEFCLSLFSLRLRFSPLFLVARRVLRNLMNAHDKPRLVIASISRDWLEGRSILSGAKTSMNNDVF